MRNRLLGAVLLGMSLSVGIALEHLMPMLRPMAQAPIVVAAMTDRRTSPTSADDTPRLNPAVVEAAVPVQIASQALAQPAGSAPQTSTKFTGTAAALGLTDRAGSNEAFALSSVTADSLASLVDGARAPLPFFGLLGHDLWVGPAYQRLPPVGGTEASEASKSSDTGGVSTDFSPSSWRLDVHPGGGIHITAASLLPTPLDEFGIAPGGGVEVRIPGGLELVTTSLGVDLFQHVAVSGGEVYAGITPLGPLASIYFSTGPVTARVTAVLSAGQVLTSAALTLQAGDVGFAYATGPSSSSLTGHLISGPVELTFLLSNSEPQVSLGCVLEL